MAFNYRKFYKKYYGIEFGKEFDVHHIDGDRDNNAISNLILLPKALHAKYHLCRPKTLKTEIDMSNLSNTEYEVALRFYEAMIEIQKWKQYKVELEMERWRKNEQSK